MAGKCLQARIADSYGDVDIGGICELDAADRELARFMFPQAEIASDFFTREWKLWSSSPDVMVILACTPCNPVADAGSGLGLQHPDVALTTDAVPEIVAHFGAPFFAGEQHAAIATLHNGNVLEKFDANMLIVGLCRRPSLVETFDGGDHPERRLRLGLHYERADVQDKIGPCPLLSYARSRPLVLADILEPPVDVPDDHFVDGRVVLHRVRFPLSRAFPTVAATVTVGGPGLPLFVGSRVRRSDVPASPLYVLYKFDGAVTATLFLDDRVDSEWLELVPTASLVHVAFDIDVLHELSVARTATVFGVPPVGPGKQLVLVDGRARRLTVRELFRLGGDEEALDLYKRVVPGISDYALGRKPGKSLHRSLAEAIVARVHKRARALLDVLHGATPFSEAAEQRLLPHCRSVADATAVVVFVALGATPLFLVHDDLRSLPASVRDNSHRSVVGNVAPLARCFEHELGFVPETFLAGKVGATFVVACPVGDSGGSSFRGVPVRWRPLRDVAGSPLYAAVALAYGTVLTLLDHPQCHGCVVLPPPSLCGFSSHPGPAAKPHIDLPGEARNTTTNLAEESKQYRSARRGTKHEGAAGPR